MDPGRQVIESLPDAARHWAVVVACCGLMAVFLMFAFYALFLADVDGDEHIPGDW